MRESLSGGLLKGIDGIIFDMDGTLIPFHHDFMRLRSQFGEFLAFWDMDLIDGVFVLEQISLQRSNLKKRGCSRDEVAHFVKEAFAVVDKNELRAMEKLEPDPRTVETLEIIGQMGIKMVILTRAGRALTDRVLDEIIPGDLFTRVITREDVRRYKPQPEAYINALDSMRFAPSKVLSVGDYSTDIVPSVELGMPFIGIRSPRMTDDEFKSGGAIAIIDHVKELIEL